MHSESLRSNPNDPQSHRLGRAPPRGRPRGRTAAISRLHLCPARRPRTRTRELQGPHPHRPPRHGSQPAEPLALRTQPHQRRKGGHTGPSGQLRRGKPEALHLPHLRHRPGAGPRRRTQEPHRSVPRLRQPGPQRVDGHPAVQGPRVEEARHPRRRRLRQRPAAGGHRVQEPDHRRRLEGRGGQAAPPLPGGRHALEGPGRAQAVRGGADPRRHLRGARRLRHRRHPGSVLSRMEGAVSPERGTARPEARAHADAAGHPALRAARAAQPSRHRPQLRRLRDRRRPRRPQADPLQAVHRRQRGHAADQDGAETERAGRHRLAHPGVGQEPDHALAGAQAAARRVAAAAGRRHRHRPHQARPADLRRVQGVRVPHTRSGRTACAACGGSWSTRPAGR